MIICVFISLFQAYIFVFSLCRNTSSFEADPLKTVPSKQNGAGSDNSDLINNKIPELRKQTETTSNEFTSDSEQILNPIMCIDSERTTGSHETLNYNINKSALDSSAVEGNPAPTNEDALQELRNKCVTVVEHGSCLMKASNDDTSDKSECVSMGEINETDNTLEYVGEVHSSYESGTKRHFSCPLCWKSFEKHELQMLHMKLCASQHNVTTRRLLDAVALQERQAAERKALGLPDIPTVCTVKKSSRKVSYTCILHSVMAYNKYMSLDLINEGTNSNNEIIFHFFVV